jgi:hypothetical protein
MRCGGVHLGLGQSQVRRDPRDFLSDLGRTFLGVPPNLTLAEASGGPSVKPHGHRAPTPCTAPIRPPLLTRRHHTISDMPMRSAAALDTCSACYASPLSLPSQTNIPTPCRARQHFGDLVGGVTNEVLVSAGALDLCGTR